MTEKSSRAPGRLRVVSSFAWLNAERVFRLVLGFVQTSIVARYLGPEAYGELNGSIAFVALFGGVSSLGLESIVARRLTLEPERTGVIVGTSLTLRLVSGAIVACALFVLKPSGVSVAVHSVIVWSAVAQSLQVGEGWFVSTGDQRPAALMRSVVLILAFCVRLALVAIGADLVSFAVVFVAEMGGSALLVFLQAQREFRVPLSVQLRLCGISLLSESWPALVSIVSVAVCSRIDVVLVTQMIPGESAGSYVAASRLNEIFHFIAMAISGSTIGVMVRLHDRDRVAFRRVQAALTGLAVWCGALVAFFWLCGADLIVHLVFGVKYREAPIFLRLLALGNIPVFAGAAWAVFWLANRRQLALMAITVLAAGISFLLNGVLIREFGASGAALGAVVGLVLPFVFLQGIGEARAAFLDSMRAIANPVWCASVLRGWYCEQLNAREHTRT